MQVSIEWAKELKAAAISARRANRPAWQNAHADRVLREREAKETATEYRRAEREAERARQDHKECVACLRSLPLSSFGKRSESYRKVCRPCDAKATRERYRRVRGRTGSGVARVVMTAERRRELAERTAHLTARLAGDLSQARIDDEEEWSAVAAELQRIWHLSGDKQCVSCRKSVPPPSMHPPSPANSFPHHCLSCAARAWEGNRRANYGPAVGPLKGPPKIRMNNGRSITVAEFARRVHERQNPSPDRSCRF